MLLYKFQYLSRDACVTTDITMVHFPIAHVCHLGVLERHDANSDLRGLAQVRTVERNRRRWPSPHAFAGFLSQALEEPLFHPHIASSLTPSTPPPPSPLRPPPPPPPS